MTLAKTFDRLAKRQHMTRSELYRTALRRFAEEHDALAAVAVYDKESAGGKLKTLKGSLASLV
jgi:metal-responsive CopG/Arc/MetJ family transcriptional regulator